MDAASCEYLEFEQVVASIETFAHSPGGRNTITRIKPELTRDQIRLSQQRIQEAIRYLDEVERISFRHLQSPDEALTALTVRNAVLQPQQILALNAFLKLTLALQKAVDTHKFPLLSQMLQPFEIPEPLVKQIAKSFEADGAVADAASSELKQVRRRLAGVRAKLRERLEAYLSGKDARYLIPEPFVTERAGRFVIPVRADQQNRVAGIAHATSSSGASVFLEPMPVVPLNNEALVCRDREAAAVQKVLTDLSARLRSVLQTLKPLVDTLGHLDSIFAIAEYSERYDCTFATVSSEQRLRLIEARHPILLQLLGSKEVVPISIELNPPDRVLIISGPNTGGKTVALKTVGLLSLMTQAGLPVPATDVVLPCFERILADIGDHQSIQQHESTFSAHVHRLQEIIESTKPPTLVLLDEVGRGTDPSFGAALAVAAIDHLRRRESIIVATSHHQAVKTFAGSTEGVQNASVQVDPRSWKPTYQIRMGIAGGSSGLQMARRLGLSSDLVARAQQLLDEKEVQVERYLDLLGKEKESWEEKQAELEQMRLKLEGERQQLQKQARREERQRRKQLEDSLETLGQDFKLETERYLKSVSDRFQAARIRQEAKKKAALLKDSFRRRIKEEESPYEPVDETSLREGDRVRHSLFGAEGRVLEIHGNKATVSLEGKKVQTALSDLRKVAAAREGRKRAVTVQVQAPEQTPTKLNLIGKRVEEALQTLDKYLDQAVVAQLSEVEIIHGFGTGRLKSGIGSFLSEHPHVDRFRVEGGATVIRLKS